MLGAENHEYNTRSKDTNNATDADQTDFLLALSKVEANLMKNITDLKDKVINMKDIIIKNLKDENDRLKSKVNILENRITDLEIENNRIDQCSLRNSIEISGLPQEVTNSQLEAKVVEVLKAIDVDIYI